VLAKNLIKVLSQRRAILSKDGVWCQVDGAEVCQLFFAKLDRWWCIRGRSLLQQWARFAAANHRAKLLHRLRTPRILVRHLRRVLVLWADEAKHRKAQSRVVFAFRRRLRVRGNRRALALWANEIQRLATQHRIIVRALTMMLGKFLLACFRAWCSAHKASQWAPWRLQLSFFRAWCVAHGAGFIEAAIVHPLDMTKTWHQLNSKEHESILKSARSLLNECGFTRLYR
jgi:hypothetical protein